MHHPFIPLAILIYFVVYFLLAFVWASIRVYRQTGRNPLVLPKDDSAAGFVGRWFKFSCAGLFVYLVLIAIRPAVQQVLAFLPSEWILILQLSGVLLLTTALLLTLVAQKQMQKSWRIGINPAEKTDLVTEGLFRYSRNPIFLSMLLALLGLLLIVRDGWSLLFLILAYVLIGIQIRMEEEYLTGIHGEEYLNYRKQVRRFL